MLHGLRGFLWRHLTADKTVNGTGAALQIVDDSTEVTGLGIARTTDIEFFLYEELSLERYLGLCIADADDTACEAHFVDGHIICHGTAHGLDHHVRSEAVGDLLQTSMHILSHGVDGICGTHLTGQGQFLVVDIGSDDGGTTQGRANDGTHTHHTTADDDHSVDICHLGTVHGVEAYTHRLYQCTGTRRELSGGNHLLPRQCDQFAHGTIALHTESLVMFAGIHTVVTA